MTIWGPHQHDHANPSFWLKSILSFDLILELSYVTKIIICVYFMLPVMATPPLHHKNVVCLTLASHQKND